MYAGISPLGHANILNPGGFTEAPYTATFKGVVVAKNAEDPGNRVWLSDGTGERSGLNSYGAEFWGKVSVGDEVLVYTEISPYLNQTEMLYPKLIEIMSTGNEINESTVISGADLDKNISADTDPAEKWEGVLVTVENAEAMSFTAPYFFMSDDGGTTEFRVGNGFDLFDAPFNDLLMDVGAKYNITGLVINRDGDYRIVPRDLSDIELVQGVNVEEETGLTLKIWPNPASSSIRIKAEEGIKSIEVYDSRGAILMSLNPGSESTDINIDNFRGGIYFVKTITESGDNYINRIIKR
jgi:hypothetical protein